MIELDVADLALIAARTLGVGTDAALAQLDVAAARAALAEARLAAVTPAATQGSRDAAAGALTDRAAAAAAGAGLMLALLHHRPCPGHGGRVAVAAGLQFLAVNGWRADLEPPGAAAELIAGLASGQLSAAYAAAWLSPRLVPRHASPPTKASMHTPLPGLWSRAVDFLRAPIAAVLPRRVVGVHTRATGFIPLTDHARDSIGLAWRLGGRHLDTEDLLLALFRESEGAAAHALARLGAGESQVRGTVTALTAEPRG